MIDQPFLQIIDAHPPWTVRVIGRKFVRGHFAKPMSVAEMIERSGLSKSTIARITYRQSWTRIPSDTISAYCYALKVNILSRQQFRRFAQRHGKRRYEGFTKRQRAKYEQLELEMAKMVSLK